MLGTKRGREISENSVSCRQLRPQHSASELLARLYRSFRGDGCPHALAQVPACALLDLRCFQSFALSPHSLQAWLALAGRKTKSNSSAATPTSAPRSVLAKLLRSARASCLCRLGDNMRISAAGSFLANIGFFLSWEQWPISMEPTGRCMVPAHENTRFLSALKCHCPRRFHPLCTRCLVWPENRRTRFPSLVRR